MTAIAKEVAETSFNEPPKSPMGVLVALTITTSLIIFTFSLSLKFFSKLFLFLQDFSIPTVVSQYWLYNNLETVIPAKAGIQIASGPQGPPSGVEPPLGWNLAQREKTGFRIKSGMTTL